MRMQILIDIFLTEVDRFWHIFDSENTHAGDISVGDMTDKFEVTWVLLGAFGEPDCE